MDAIRLLVAQHGAIEGLFEQVEQETRRRARTSAVARLAEELIAHMAAEEAVFYPAARRVLDEGSGGRLGRREEHLLLRVELRRVLETSVTATTFSERIAALHELFGDHVRKEEAELFPRMASAVSEAQLEVLGAELLASRPPVWIVTTEGHALIDSGSEFALRSRVSLPMPPSRE